MSEVKRWRVYPRDLWLSNKPHKHETSNEIVLASDYDAVVRERDEALSLASWTRMTCSSGHYMYREPGHECTPCQRCRAEKAERVAEASDRHALACRNEIDAIRADRDRYKGMVERQRPVIDAALVWSRAQEGLTPVSFTNAGRLLQATFTLDRSLAEPGPSESLPPDCACHGFDRCETHGGCKLCKKFLAWKPDHGYGRCVERRVFDARKSCRCQRGQFAGWKCGDDRKHIGK